MRQAPEQDVAATFALIALGGNVATESGPPEVTLAAAITEIGHEVGTVLAESRLFRTPCFPAGAGPDYVNAAVRIETTMEATAVLATLHRIELHHGRERVQRWGMRTLDLDLIAFGDLVMPDRAGFDDWYSLPPDLQTMRAPDHLILPHPRVQDRSFVLVPLEEVAPDWRHPVLGLTVTEMRDARPLAERAEVVPI